MGPSGFSALGWPGWTRSDRYDILARPEKPEASDIGEKTSDEEQKTPADRLHERVRTLLAERFRLVIRHESSERPVYALVQVRGGHKLQPVTTAGRGIMRNHGTLQGDAVPVPMLAAMLSRIVSRPVLDQSGISGKFNFKLEWAEEPDALGKADVPAAAGLPANFAGASVFTAIQEQLGLKLEATKGPVEVIVIERVEKPTAN